MENTPNREGHGERAWSHFRKRHGETETSGWLSGGELPDIEVPRRRGLSSIPADPPFLKPTR
jgi:hypothetical protein